MILVLEIDSGGFTDAVTASGDFELSRLIVSGHEKGQSGIL